MLIIRLLAFSIVVLMVRQACGYDYAVEYHYSNGKEYRVGTANWSREAVAERINPVTQETITGSLNRITTHFNYNPLRSPNTLDQSFFDESLFNRIEQLHQEEYNFLSHPLDIKEEYLYWVNYGDFTHYEKVTGGSNNDRIIHTPVTKLRKFRQSLVSLNFNATPDTTRTSRYDQHRVQQHARLLWLFNNPGGNGTLFDSFDVHLFSMTPPTNLLYPDRSPYTETVRHSSIEFSPLSPSAFQAVNMNKLLEIGEYYDTPDVTHLNHIIPWDWTYAYQMHQFPTFVSKVHIEPSSLRLYEYDEAGVLFKQLVPTAFNKISFHLDHGNMGYNIYFVPGSAVAHGWEVVELGTNRKLRYIFIDKSDQAKEAARIMAAEIARSPVQQPQNPDMTDSGGHTTSERGHWQDIKDWASKLVDTHNRKSVPMHLLIKAQIILGGSIRYALPMNLSPSLMTP